VGFSKSVFLPAGDPQITLQNSVARIYIDGKLAAENASFPFSPEDVRARAGRIGAGLSGTGFIGVLDDFAVFRTGFANIADVWANPDKSQ